MAIPVDETFKLGFGLMRLPKKDGVIDIEESCRMTDAFLAAGGTYFDTAYVYGGSEEAARKFLVERHPRSAYTLADKLNAAMLAHDEASAKQEFYTSLERTGAGYFDYYLLHALNRDNRRLYDEYGIWDFVRQRKEEGLIRHMGFSFHADPDLLEELLIQHPETEFVQLQINYADWESDSVFSRANYEVARKYGKPVVIMEPVKGGMLADPVPSVKQIMEEAAPEMTCASWAIRFAASLPGVLAVLSGMSNMAQMEDNLSYMKDFRPLSEEEQAVIGRVREALSGIEGIPCTACHYCTDGCPMSIPIPEIFKAANQLLVYNAREKSAKTYRDAVRDKGKASDCVGCMQCEGACPQQIKITEHLAACAARWDQ